LIIEDPAANVSAALTHIPVVSVGFTGSIARVSLDLPRPMGVVHLHVDGAVRDLRLKRPAGVPVDTRILGAATDLHVDGLALRAIGRGYTSQTGDGGDRYVLTITHAADGVHITS
jgi:hypothetical protein